MNGISSAFGSNRCNEVCYSFIRGKEIRHVEKAFATNTRMNEISSECGLNRYNEICYSCIRGQAIKQLEKAFATNTRMNGVCSLFHSFFGIRNIAIRAFVAKLSTGEKRIRILLVLKKPDCFRIQPRPTLEPPSSLYL